MAEQVSYAYPCTPLFWVCCLLGHRRALSRVPCAVERVLILACFIHSVNVSVPFSQVILSPPFPLGIHAFVLCICVCLCFVSKIIYTILSDFTHRC